MDESLYVSVDKLSWMSFWMPWRNRLINWSMLREQNNNKHRIQENDQNDETWLSELYLNINLGILIL